MPLFEDLPNEVIELIFEALPKVAAEDEYGKSEDLIARREFARVSLVCCRLYYLVTPFLFRTVNCYGHTKSLRRFLRTMCSHPDLAPHVSRLRLSWHPILDQESPRQHGVHSHSETLDVDDRLYIDSAAKLGDADLTRALEGKSKEAQAILLLHLLPVVKTLEIRPPTFVTLFDAVMKSVMDIMVLLFRCRKVYVLPERYGFCQGGSCSQFMAFLYGMRLPSIKATSGLWFFTQTWFCDEARTSSLYHTSPVQPLSFHESLIGASVFDELLRIPKELREFPITYTDGSPGLNPSSLRTLGKRLDMSVIR